MTDTQGRQQRVLPYVEPETLDVQAATNTAKTATTTSTIATAMVVTTMKLLLIPDLIKCLLDVCQCASYFTYIFLFDFHNT